MRLDECLRVINRRLRSAEQEVARRQRLGLQTRPWQHRVQELVETRQEIAAHVWGIDFQTSTNVLDVMVRRLRAKVDDPFPTKLIHTVRGAGYVLKAY